MNQNDIYQLRNRLHLNLSSTSRGGFILCLLLGIGSFVGGMLVGEQTRTWGSFLFNLMFFFSLALGGVAFGNMQDLIGAKWGRPIKRLHESFSSFLPVSLGFFLFFFVSIKFGFLGAQDVYQWIADPHLLDHFPGKNQWLTPNFMLIRDIFCLLIIIGLAKWHMDLTLAGDRSLINGDREEATRLGEKARSTLRYWSAPVLVLHALAFTCLVFDLTMSLAPTWFSTLWGGWSFAIMMHSLMAFILLCLFTFQSSPIGVFFRRQQYHDIGKIMHGFTAFFAYLTFAHVLTYWYTNIPEETSYLLTRMEKPWVYLVVTVPLLSFVIPIFMLCPKAAKWNPILAIPLSVLIFFSHWLTYLLVVIPEVADRKIWLIPWIEVGLFLGFFGVFLFSFYRFAAKNPMVSISDPLLLSSLDDSH